MSSSILINVQYVFLLFVLKYKKLHNTLSGKIIFYTINNELLLNCIKKIDNRTFSTGRHPRRTPVPVWTHAACNAGGAAWCISCFRSSKPSVCRMFKSWWAWVLVGEVGLNFKIVSSLLWLAMKITVSTGTVKSSALVATKTEPACQRPKVAMSALTASADCYYDTQ
jgi:hypothetical protein